MALPKVKFIDTDNQIYLDTGDSNKLKITNEGTDLIDIGVTTGTNINGDLTVDTDTLVVDATNNRIGIVNSTPSYTMDVNGDINTSTDYNIGGTQVLSSTTLGSGIVNSSLTSVGTLTSLDVSGDLTVDTNTLYVDSTNNEVGIGTLTPARLLDVNGASLFRGDLTFDNLNFDIDYTNGRVGIGQTAGSDALTVNGSTTLSGDLTVDTNTLYVDSTNNRVGILDTTPSYTMDVNGDINFTGTLYNNGITFESGGAFTDTGSEAYYTDGNVGIGTTNPLVKLDVDGSITARTSLGVGFTGTTNGDFQINIGSNNCGIGNSSNELTLWTSNIERIRVDDSGLVGIGTTNPSSKLHIYNDSANPELTLETTNDGSNLYPIIKLKNSQISAGETIGTIQFENTDGDTDTLAEIQCHKQNTANIRGQLRFFCHDVSSLDEKMRIGEYGTMRHFDNLGQDTVSLFQVYKSSTGSTNNKFMTFYRSASSLSSGTEEGDITLDGSGNLAFANTSDRRLKENITEYKGGLSIIKELRSVEYDWKDEDKPNGVKGFIAQEVRDYLPSSVSGNETEDEYLKITTEEMIPVMWSAIRELTNKIKNATSLEELQNSL
jgi:ethanolamine utilization microcompartment shell protein EutS